MVLKFFRLVLNRY